jgi:hypothetical protein
MRNEPERYEFQVPIRLSVRNRTVEVPLTVSVSGSQLAEIVTRHLETGEEIHTALLETYADHVSPAPAPKRARSRSQNGRSAPGEEAVDGARPEEAAAPEPEGPSPVRRRPRGV